MLGTGIIFWGTAKFGYQQKVKVTESKKLVTESKVRHLPAWEGGEWPALKAASTRGKRPVEQCRQDKVDCREAGKWLLAEGKTFYCPLESNRLDTYVMRHELTQLSLAFA